MISFRQSVVSFRDWGVCDEAVIVFNKMADA